MAMTDLTWNRVTISAISSPLWTGSYMVPPFIVDAIASGGSVLVFCIYDLGIGSDALISFLGGGATLPSGAFTVVSTPAMNISVTSTSENWYSVRDSSGAGWLWYGDQYGAVRFMPSSGALGSFIT